MRHVIWCVLAMGLIAFTFTASAEDHCYRCAADGCCAEQYQNLNGKTSCTNGNFCWTSGCSCIDCKTRGLACSGSAEPPCPNPNGICEEHQTLLVTPNGEANGTWTRSALGDDRAPGFSPCTVAAL